MKNINEIIEWFHNKGISLRLTRHEREAKEEMRKQQSFTSLFDESKTKIAIEKVFSNLQTTVIAPKTIRKLLYSTREQYPTFVMNFFTGQEEISLDSMRKSDLEFFRIHEIFDMLNSKTIKFDNITKEQKDFLYVWCCKKIPKVDFKYATRETESGYSTNWYAIMVSFFSFCFELDYDKKFIKT